MVTESGRAVWSSEPREQKVGRCYRAIRPRTRGRRPDRSMTLGCPQAA